MTLIQFFTTLLGGFLLPFTILLLWGKMVDRFGAKGGFLAAFMIIGPIWFLNHGMAHPLIHQGSSVFIDMGYATAIGLLAYGLFRGLGIKVHLHNLAAMLIGGCLAGLIIHILF
ncbi:hypothetical protein MXZ89_05200 [Streptococcus uberis]|uniref:Lin0368 family putative glycerol transporter subunit n=1 Tax=Streptococcus uberis TaxID=1349 RepID=UPI001FF449A5|nr:hypothetical protein [Streptococcus uberis]MCK1189460.1 hypothetical protein [Streptococcus uberis]MCK1211251.1 hypothetical protein [Streptococcus uberis]MCK1216744.1 hypothetical protein [Streptococcus uberis]MCK1242456.1 hypothetical protein [Streptococcus uberis]MCK1255849.1 hypothetical protein [Streptococcus uberis]